MAQPLRTPGRVRANAVPLTRGARPIDDFLSVWDEPMPLATSELALASAQKQWGPTHVALPAPILEEEDGPTSLPPQPFREIGQTSDRVQTLDGFIEDLTGPDTILAPPGVPSFADLARLRSQTEQAREVLQTAALEPAPQMTLPGLRPPRRPDNLKVADAPSDLPAQIRATVGAEMIAVETPERRVLAPRRVVPASRFAIVLTDTYAVPFDLSGSGRPALQRTPLLRPAIADGETAAPEPTATMISASPNLAAFFPGAPKPAPVPLGPELDVDPAIAMLDELRGGLEETLGALEITMETPEEILGEDAGSLRPTPPVVPDASRPALNLPPLDSAVRPLAAAPLVDGPAVETPAAPAPTETVPAPAPAPSAPAPAAATGTPSAVPTGTPPAETGPVPLNPVPFAPSPPVAVGAPVGSILERDTRRVAPPVANEGLMIRLSYAASADEVTQRVRELMRNFPQSMLEKGRFYGSAAPASPGLFIVGIQAHNATDRDDLVAYMTNNGIPFVLPGQSAAPLLGP